MRRKLEPCSIELASALDLLAVLTVRGGSGSGSPPLMLHLA